MSRTLLLVDPLLDATLEALTAARRLGTVTVVAIGALDDAAAATLAAHGARDVVVAEHPLLSRYGPETWGAALTDLIAELQPEVAIACGTSVGNEVLATAAARLDLPFVANCVDIAADARSMERVQWGGSLREHVAVDVPAGAPVLLSVAHHAYEAEPAAGDVDIDRRSIAVALEGVTDRACAVRTEIAEAGVTLATASVVVGGGRGTGSPEGFAPLEELAELLGGRVGCSRAVTNNGWRPHSDQVGQTGTRIAPQLYIAAGISGAIQHWVGAMASKRILAINTDPQANMVTKADDAVIADLHQVIPAIIEEIHRRQATRQAS